MLKWIQENQILSGLGGTLLLMIGAGVKYLFFSGKRNQAVAAAPSLPDAKARCKILFVDDQEFRVVDILQKAGWTNSKRVRDIKSLDDAEVSSTDIFFVDIQGVGKALGFSDEGLGLATALKEKYPEKCVVIYSAQTQGDRFHKALKKADDCLPKNADPYEFQQLVEQWACKRDQ